MSQLFARRQLQLSDLETLLEDKVPQYSVIRTVDIHSGEVLRVKKSTHVGAEISLKVHDPRAKSVIKAVPWDPHETLGSFTGGSSWNIPAQFEFAKEMFALLTANIEGDVVPDDPIKCFVATAAAGHADDRNVVILRQLRDNHLIYHRTGRFAIRLYEIIGPVLAEMIGRSRLARRLTYAACVQPSAALVVRIVHGRTSKERMRG